MVKTVEVIIVKIKHDICGQVTAETCTVWVKKGSITLYDHKQMMLNGDAKFIDLQYSKTMLKNQFPELMGLYSTLLLKEPQPRFQGDKPYYLTGDHWIVASTLFTRSGQIKVYDSVFTTIDKETKAGISIWTRSFTSFGKY